MTLLSQLGLWVTGSDLNKNLKKLRIIITLLTSVLLGLLLIANTFASTYYTTQALEKKRPIYNKIESAGNNQSTIEYEKRKLELETRKEFIQQQFDATVYANVLLLLILTTLTYFLLYPILKPIQTEAENREKFLSHASHELRTPLAIIYSNLSLAPKTQLIINTLNEIKKLQNISNRILGGYNDTFNIITKKSQSIKSIIEEIINDLEPINQNNISNIINDNSDFKTYNYIEFYQILYNAISNIYYYSEPNTNFICNIDNDTIVLKNLTNESDYTKSIGIEIMEQEASRINMTVTTNNYDNIFTTIISKK